MSNVAEKIWSASNQFPKNEAIVTPLSRLEYRDFAALVSGIQNELYKVSSKPERIGIMTDDSVYTYAAIVAVLASGAAYVPVNSKNPPARNLDVIDRAGVDFIFAHEDDFQLEPDASSPHRFVNLRNSVPDNRPWKIAQVSNDDLAYILFTSGSTGQPKGVPISHGNLHAFANATFENGPYTVDSNDRFLQMFELTFDLSVMCLLIPLSHGATICVVPESGIGFMNVAKTLEDEAVTIALMVPSILSYMQRFLPELRFPSVHTSLFCGEALPLELLNLWEACVPNAVIENTYGPTEATIFCSRFTHTKPGNDGDVYQGVVSIGRPLPGVELFVLDDANAVLPPGERGELCIAGNQLMDQYWKDPEKTEIVMTDLNLEGRTLRVYHTGDLAYVNDNGNLIFCGRKDFQIKIDGHRVELGEIEHHAREFLGHGMVAVLFNHDANNQDRLVLFAEAGSKNEIRNLGEYLSGQLPTYMQPSRVEELDKMPINLNGKIDRPTLRKSFFE
jgi:amino acid adenylation domain-containing protein